MQPASQVLFLPKIFVSISTTLRRSKLGKDHMPYTSIVILKFILLVDTSIA